MFSLTVINGDGEIYTSTANLSNGSYVEKKSRKRLFHNKYPCGCVPVSTTIFELVKEGHSTGVLQNVMFNVVGSLLEFDQYLTIYTYSMFEQLSTKKET
jgi:hypothetical protein